MPNMKNISTLLLAAGLLALTQACKKESPPAPAPPPAVTCDTAFSMGASRSQSQFNRIFCNVDASYYTTGTYSVLWQLGDGDTSTSLSFHHDYHVTSGSHTYFPKLYVFNNCGDTLIYKDTVVISPDSFSYFYRFDTMAYQATMQNIVLSAWGSPSITAGAAVFNVYKWSDNGGFGLSYWQVLTAPPYPDIDVDIITNDTTAFGLPKPGVYNVTAGQATCYLQLYNTNEQYAGYALRDTARPAFNSTYGNIKITRSDTIVTGTFAFRTLDTDATAPFATSDVTNGYFQLTKYKLWYAH
jgi:hypothetical protein